MTCRQDEPRRSAAHGAIRAALLALDVSIEDSSSDWPATVFVSGRWKIALDVTGACDGTASSAPSGAATARRRNLESEGWQVLRFSASEVLKDVGGGSCAMRRPDPLAVVAKALARACPEGFAHLPVAISTCPETPKGGAERLPKQEPQRRSRQPSAASIGPPERKERWPRLRPKDTAKASK